MQGQLLFTKAEVKAIIKTEFDNMSKILKTMPSVLPEQYQTGSMAEFLKFWFARLEEELFFVAIILLILSTTKN